MPELDGRKAFLSGVPLGGIGAGKMELLPSGLFSNFTFLNNWGRPLDGQGKFPGILGYHLGVFVERENGDRKAFLLQTAPLGGLPIVRSIRYDGRFPLAVLKYHEPSLGLDITLEAFSPWATSDPRQASLPCVYFAIHVKNKRPGKVRVAFLFIGRNVCGDWCVGRRNRIREDKKNVHLDLSSASHAGDPRRGQIRFSFEKDGWSTSFFESWNAVKKNFRFDARNIRLSAWDEFSQSGRLPDARSPRTAQGENRELCGAVAASAALGPGRQKTWAFTASWHFPHHSFGHRYTRWFRDAAAVQKYAQPRRKFFRKKIGKFHRLVSQLPLPAWFQDALINNLSPFFSSSWYVRDGRFAFYEAPVICPLMGTVDVGFYGSIPLGYFFPALERSQILQFARFQRHDGYIPHDLGRDRIDTPSDGTTFYFWKDLNPKFTLMAYRDLLWSGEGGFLKKIYPHVKKAMQWSARSDKDGDGLPDHEGADQTFDLWDFKGANAYTAGIYLAALLACEKMARRTGDKAFAGQCRERFRKGRETFERVLWNGEYFGEACELAQLNGQWYADLLGLGDIADPWKINKALKNILSKNRKHSNFGLVNSVLPDGRLDMSNNHSKNIWLGMNYAFIGLCISRGLPVKNVLKPAYSLWHNVTQRQKNPWNQPDMIDRQTGRFVFGDAYYRNMAIWAIPMALAGRDERAARVLKALRNV